MTLPGMAPIKVALIGAGNWARDAHVPTFRSLPGVFEVVAIYGRNRQKAEALAASLPTRPAVLERFEDVLARDDVEAVDIVLPLDVAPDYIERALAAGKHVVSEKPIAADSASARRLIEAWRRTRCVWMVAESWRYMTAIRAAAEVVRSGQIGTPRLAHLAAYFNVELGGPFDTPWRRSATFEGGYLLDGGVHLIATLRAVLGEISEVCALSSQVSPVLPTPDTVTASVRFKSGAVGALAITFGLPSLVTCVLQVAGDRGSLLWNGETVEIKVGSEVTTYPGDTDEVKAELTAFAQAIRFGAPHRNSPDEALADVLVIEALLEAARSGRRQTL